MHVKEVPVLLFREFVKDPITKSEQEYAEEMGWSNEPGYYSTKPVLVGESSNGTFLRHGENEVYTYLSVHSSLGSSIINGKSIFGSHFSLVAGSKDTGVWTYGGGRVVEQNIWIQANTGEHHGPENIRFFVSAAETMGRIATRALELIESDTLEISRFNERDLEL